MNKDIKSAWLAALRSGEYKQGVGQLKDNTSYCCLGILCDLHSKATGQEWGDPNEDGVESYIGIETTPPIPVVKWAGLPYDNPGMTIKNDGDEDENSTELPIAELNDSGWTFLEIADLIEEQL